MTTTTMREVLASADIVVVEYGARWCGTCHAYAPVFAALETRHPDITFATVDTDAEQDLTAAAGVSTLPTVQFFRAGRPVFSHPGPLRRAGFDAVLAQVRALPEVDADA